MKIVHICLSAFYIDNYSYQENLLPKYHVKQGHEVTVIASLFTFNEEGKGVYLSQSSKYKDANGYSVIRLAYKKPTSLNKIFRHYVGLKKELDILEPDIIFLHNASFGDTPVIRLYLKQHPSVKLFADSHVDYINSARNWLSLHVLHSIIWKHYIKILEPYYVKCYGVTPMRCRFLKDVYKIPSQMIEYLPLGVDDDLIPKDRLSARIICRRELGISNGDFLIATGGKIDKLKNTHVLLDAIHLLNNPRIHLVICGVLTPEMEYLSSIINDNPNIHYLGWCNAEKVMNVMVSADMACFPGTHSTLWEQAVGVGLPSVFKRWPEMEHVNINGNCLFVNGSDRDELLSAINQIITGYDTYLRLAKDASNMFLYSEISKKAIEY